MKFNELAKNRRSIRKFTGEKVSKEDIETILETTLTSPAACNRDSVHYYVFQDEKSLEKLSKLKPSGADFLRECDVAIMILGDKELSPGTYFQDECIADTTMQLQVHDMGLGSCWVNIVGGQYDENITSYEYLLKEFDIPEKFDIQCIIGIGYPAEDPEPRNNRKIKDFVRFDK